MRKPNRLLKELNQAIEVGANLRNSEVLVSAINFSKQKKEDSWCGEEPDGRWHCPLEDGRWNWYGEA
jgi:hypothetical protein